MLTRKTLNLAKHIAKNNKFILGAPRTSIFAQAIRTSLPIMAQKAPSLESAVVGVEKASSNMAGGSNEHDTAVSEAVSIIATGMSNSFDYVRKTVIPFTGAVTNTLMEKIESDRPKGYSIIQVDLPEIVGNDLFKDMIAPYVNPSNIIKVLESARQFEYPGELVDLLKTGLPSVDADLAKIIARITPEAVVDIYRVLFCNQRPVAPIGRQGEVIANMVTKISNGYTFNVKGYENLDISIVAFMLVDHFLANPMNSVGLSLNDYRTVLKSMRNAIGHAIRSSIKIYDNYTNSRIVITKFPDSNGIHFSDEDGYIYVCGSVYRKGIENNLTPEMVIGAAIEGKVRNLDLILKSGAGYINLYEKAIREAVSYSNSNRERFFISNVKSVFQSEVNKLTDDALPTGYDRITTVSNVCDVNKIRAFFNTQYDEESGNLNVLVEELACEHIFNFTDAGTIIKLINSELDATEDGVTVKQAAYVAYLRYIARWAIATFDVVRNDVTETE